MPFRSIPRRGSLIAAAVASVALLAPTGAAQAAPAKQTQKKAIWGPASVGGVSQFPAYRDLGVGIYQYPLVWSDVAPTKPADPSDPNDPAYRWPASLDVARTEAAKYAIKMSLRVTGTPGWANGGKARSVLPTDRADYTTFLKAAAARYPAVRLWQIWEEPNLNRNLELQTSATFVNGSEVPSNRALSATQRGQIGRYAQLLDASYASLKGLSSRNLVIGGALTSCGSVGPQRFMQGMKLGNGRAPRMDLIGANPYSPRRPDLALGRLSAGCADFGDLDTFHGWSGDYLARSKASAGPRIFVSEFSDPTDVPSYLFNWHVTRSTQARFISQALAVTRRTPWLYTFGWYSYQDLAPQNGVESRVGLVDAKLVKKPGYYAFKRG